MTHCTAIEIINIPEWIGPEYLIQGRLFLDIAESNQSIPQNIRTEELTDFNKIQVSELIGIDLPRTPVNDAVLKNIADPNTWRRKNGIQVRAWQGANLLIQNRMFLITFSNTYQIELRLSEDHWAIASNRLKLVDLDLGTFEFSKSNVEAVQDNNAKYLDGDIGIWFPLVNFGGTYRRGYIIPEDYRVHHHILPILKAGFCALGFTFESPIFESDVWRHVLAYLLSKTYGPLKERNFKVAISEDKVFPIPGNRVVLSNRLEFEDIIFDPQSQYDIVEHEFSGGSNGRFYVKLDFSLYRGFNAIPRVLEIIVNLRRENEQDEEILATFSYKNTLRVDTTYDFTASLISGIVQTTQQDRVYVELLISTDNINGSVLTLRQGGTFYNEPKFNLYSEGDIIDIAKLINPEYTFAEFFKGLLHPISGLIKTDWVTKTVSVFPYRTIQDYYGEQIEGFYKDEFIDIQSYVSPGSLKSSTEEINKERFIYLGFKKSTDPSIEQLDLPDDEGLFSNTIDLGDQFLDETIRNENPFFEPTLNKQWNGIGEQTVAPSVPHMLDNDRGELSFDIKPRLLYAHGKTFMRNVDANQLAAFRYDGNYIANVPLAYQRLDGFQEQILNPADLYPFDRMLVYGKDENDFYNHFWRHRIYKLFSSDKLEFLVHLDLNKIDLWSLRNKYVFVYEDMPVNARISEIKDFKGCSDVMTPVVFVPDFTGSGPCTDEDSEEEDLGCFENTRRMLLTVNLVGDCYVLQIFGSTSFTIEDVIYEWRYINESEWTQSNQVCNPDRQFVARAIISFDNNCPDLVITRVVEPCANVDAGFFLNYNYQTNCMSIQVTGVPGNLVESILIEYQLEGDDIWIEYDSPICDFTGEICARATIVLNNGCPDIELEECFYSPPPPQPPPPEDCEMNDSSVECGYGETGIIPQRIGGSIINPDLLLLDLIQYKYTEDGETQIWDGITELNCPIWIRRVQIFCNNACPPYCGPWVYCFCDPCTDSAGNPQNLSVCNDGDCIIGLRNRMPGSENYGTWVFDGFSSDSIGTPGAGGTDPGTLNGNNPSINFNGFVPGFYFFTYTLEQPECEPQSEQLIIQVLPAVSCNPENETLEYCEGETGIIDIHDVFETAESSTCTITNIQSTGQSAIDPNDINGNEIDLLNYSIGSYQLSITYGTDTVPEFEVSCGSCTKVVTLSISIIDCNECELEAGEPNNQLICN